MKRNDAYGDVGGRGMKMGAYVQIENSAVDEPEYAEPR